MPITWDESMTTGVPTVDAQHRELFRQVNAFHTAMSQGKATEELAKLLDFMGQYTVRHFADEERYMEQFKCSAAETNKAAHKQLLETYERLRQQFDQQGGSLLVTMEIYRTLSDWLVKHVKGVDSKLRQAVQSAKEPVGASS